jgi:tight adherence protein B
MRSNVELGILVVAFVAVAYLLADLARNRMRLQREGEMIDRLAGAEPDALAPVDVGRMDRRLRAAGLRGPAEAYLFAGSLVAAAVSVVLLGLLPAVPLVAAIGLVLALYAEWALVAALARRRANQFEQQLIDAIDLMAGTLNAGGNLTQSLRTAGDASKQPLKGEFSEAFRRLALGMSIRRALTRMVESYDCEGVRLFSQTLAAKLEAGGELSPVLRSLNETLRDRSRQQRQIQAQLAGARVTAVAVVALPYLLAPLLAWMQPGWFSMLFNSNIGTALLFIAVLLQIIGILWLWHILEKEL